MSPLYHHNISPLCRICVDRGSHLRQPLHVCTDLVADVFNEVVKPRNNKSITDLRCTYAGVYSRPHSTLVTPSVKCRMIQLYLREYPGQLSRQKRQGACNNIRAPPSPKQSCFVANMCCCSWHCVSPPSGHAVACHPAADHSAPWTQGSTIRPATRPAAGRALAKSLSITLSDMVLPNMWPIWA